MKIHALDRGQRTGAPFRRLGALMDFANDLMVLSKLNKKRIIRLERFATGHQVVETGLITGQDIFLLPGTGEELQESSSKRVRFECDAFDSVSTEHHEKRLQGSRPTVYSVILLNQRDGSQQRPLETSPPKPSCRVPRLRSEDCIRQ